MDLIHWKFIDQAGCGESVCVLRLNAWCKEEESLAVVGIDDEWQQYVVWTIEDESILAWTGDGTFKALPQETPHTTYVTASITAGFLSLYIPVTSLRHSYNPIIR